MKPVNEMDLKFLSRSSNESFARAAVAAFVAQIDPTSDELADIKTAVSEAVTNAIVHGYRGREDGLVRMSAEYGDRRLLTVVIRDEGCGIADVEKAMQAGWSTASEAVRQQGFGAGMGLPNMKKYSDEMSIDSVVGEGTTVYMTVFPGRKEEGR